MKSELIAWMDNIERTEHWHLRINHHDMLRMTREQREMVQDGLWLIEQALKGEHTEGPLTLPKTRLPIRAP